MNNFVCAMGIHLTIDSGKLIRRVVKVNTLAYNKVILICSESLIMQLESISLALCWYKRRYSSEEMFV